MYAALKYAASFHCLVEEWKDCEELKPKPEEKWLEHFLHHSRTTPCLFRCSDQVTTSTLTLSQFSKLFDRNFGPVHVPGIFMYLLLFPHLRFPRTTYVSSPLFF